VGIKALPLPNHRLIAIGVSGIVILNLVRLAAGLANLIAIPFRKSPIEGIMFLIPPMTFLYIWQNWKRMEKPVGRILGPTFALALVVAAYTAIAIFGKGRHASGNILKEVDSAVKSIKKDVGASVEQLQNNVETIQKQIPSQVDSAKKAIEELQDRVQNATGDRPVPDKNDTDNQK
jgi:gas vesicle protein